MHQESRCSEETRNLSEEIKGSYFESFNGASIKLYEFGGRGPLLLIAHATGFNSRAYYALGSYLSNEFSVIGIDAEGHGGSQKTSDGQNWSNYAKHITFYLQSHGISEIYGFGHSFGGAALLQVVANVPRVFRAVIAYEPVIFPGPSATEPNFSSPIAQLTLKRQFTFDSRTRAIENFESKPPMNNFAPGVVADYVDGGTFINAEGMTELSCHRDFEAAIYAHAQMAGVDEVLPKVQCPVTYLYGDVSRDFSIEFYQAVAAKTPQGKLTSIDSVGHFGPFEDPRRISELVIKSCVEDQ